MSADGTSHDDLRRRIADLHEANTYRVEQVVDGLTEAIVDRMLELSLSRAGLAERLGVTPARVTNLLRGANNFTIRTLVDLSAALECDLTVSLVPHLAGSDEKSADLPVVAAESPAVYRAAHRGASYASRDGEIREHLLSGKLKVEGDRVFMRHEDDQSYRLARFRPSGTHSTQEKTNVGRHAYYRSRILAVAKSISGSRPS